MQRENNNNKKRQLLNIFYINDSVKLLNELSKLTNGGRFKKSICSLNNSSDMLFFHHFFCFDKYVN